MTAHHSRRRRPRRRPRAPTPRCCAGSSKPARARSRSAFLVLVGAGRDLRAVARAARPEPRLAADILAPPSPSTCSAPTARAATSSRGCSRRPGRASPPRSLALVVAARDRRDRRADRRLLRRWFDSASVLAHLALWRCPASWCCSPRARSSARRSGSRCRSSADPVARRSTASSTPRSRRCATSCTSTPPASRA